MLWLAYAEGSSHQEIAAALGVKTASVKLLLFRARRRLAGILGRAPARARGRMMTHVECVREDDVLMMVSTGRWPELRRRRTSRARGALPGVPRTGLLRDGEEAEASASLKGPKRPRPAERGNGLVACAVAGATGSRAAGGSANYRGADLAIRGGRGRGRRDVRRDDAGSSARSAGSAARSAPSATTSACRNCLLLPQDLSGIWIGYWVVLAVVVFSLIAGAGIMRWAMKED